MTLQKSSLLHFFPCLAMLQSQMLSCCKMRSRTHLELENVELHPLWNFRGWESTSVRGLVGLGIPGIGGKAALLLGLILMGVLMYS